MWARRIGEKSIRRVQVLLAPDDVRRAHVAAPDFRPDAVQPPEHPPRAAPEVEDALARRQVDAGLGEKEPHRFNVPPPAGQVLLGRLAISEPKVPGRYGKLCARGTPRPGGQGPSIGLGRVGEKAGGNRCVPPNDAPDSLREVAGTIDEQVPGSAENRLEQGSGFHRRAPLGNAQVCTGPASTRSSPPRRRAESGSAP